MPFQMRQATLRRAHQVMHRRVGRAHLGEHLFGRHAAVHQPDSAGLAVLSFDMLEKRPQRRLVCGVAGQHLISQRQTFGCHYQGNDDLHTIRPVTARVPEAPLVAFRKRWIGLKADFRPPGPRRPLPLNHLPGKNRGTLGRIGEVGLVAKPEQPLPANRQPEAPGLLCCRFGSQLPGCIAFNSSLN
jgi:hypothetical protein